jgi:hypothetical protein
MSLLKLKKLHCILAFFADDICKKLSDAKVSLGYLSRYYVKTVSKERVKYFSPVLRSENQPYLFQKHGIYSWKNMNKSRKNYMDQPININKDPLMFQMG